MKPGSENAGGRQMATCDISRLGVGIWSPLRGEKEGAYRGETNDICDHGTRSTIEVAHFV